MKKLGWLVLTFSLLVPLTSFAVPQPNRARAIEQLRNLQHGHLQSLEALDQKIRAELQNTRNIEFSAQGTLAAGGDFDALNSTLEKLQKERIELVLRRDFVDRLIFQIDSKWNTQQPLQHFLERQLLEMSVAEISSSQTETKMWRFLSYLSVAIREIPDPREDVLGFIEGYLKFSGISDPKSPQLFMAQRNYTNGVESVGANPVPADQVGDLVDHKISRLEATHPANNSSPDIELRLKILTPLPSENKPTVPQQL